MRVPRPAAVPAVLAFAALAGCGNQRVPLGRPSGPATTGTAAPRGDVGPHEAENNGWKQRRSLSADDLRAA